MSSKNFDDIISRLNNKDDDAFVEVYNICFNQVYYFTEKLFHDKDLCAEDVIHDIFISLWKSNIKFENLDTVKSYLYVSIRNRYRNYIAHQKCVDQYIKTAKSDNHLISNIVESETLSIITQAIEILPEDCAKIFKLHLDGWDVKEIAEQLNCSKSSVYAKKQLAIDILKRKLPKDKLLFIKLLIG